MIVALGGYAGSGKDEIGRILVENHGFRRTAFADKVRKMARAIDPYVELFVGGYVRLSTILPEEDTSAAWSEVKKFTDVRRLLQRIGTEAGREVLWPSIWIDSTLSEISEDEDVVITDARFINEFEAVENRDDGVTWRVRRPGTGPLNDHPSETEQDQWDPFMYIENDSTLDALAETVRYSLAASRNHIEGWRDFNDT